MTTRERLERKLEKREQWAESARNTASHEFDKSHSITENIPLGHPILVGHHSESAHRALIDKSLKAMERGVEATNRAEHHEQKARGLERQLNNTIFSDDVDAIEKLEAKIKNLEELQEQMKEANKILRDKKTDNDQKAEKLKALGLSEKCIHEVLNPPSYAWWGKCIPSFELSNNSAEIRRLKERLAEIKRRNEQQAKAEAAVNGVLVEDEIWNGKPTEYCHVQFAEKPDYSIIKDLKAAGFYWRRGFWAGKRADLPESDKKLIEE